jgi:membrane protease YdiL (CAAX protease family)
MLSDKPWKLEAVMRLFLGVIICACAGSVVIGALRFFNGAAKLDARLFLALVAGSIGSLGGALAAIRRPWPADRFTGRFMMLLGCLYLGLTLGSLAQHYATGADAADSTAYMIITVLSFQGAALMLIWRFMHEHRLRWADAFGFHVKWKRALLFGVLTACAFLPVGQLLQLASAELMTHFHLKPVEQQAVQVFRLTESVWYRLSLGVTAVFLAPIAEEMLFRGILYRAVKQTGFPRLALWGSAVVFAAWHQNPATFVPLLLLAVVLTVLYEKTNNLLAAIAAHSFFNIMNFVQLYLGW